MKIDAILLIFWFSIFCLALLFAGWKNHKILGPLKKKLLETKNGQEFSETQRIFFQKQHQLMNQHGIILIGVMVFLIILVAIDHFLIRSYFGII